MKKLTLDQLKSLYWEFKKKLMEVEITYGGGYGYSGCGGSSTKIVYKNSVEDFLVWLEENKKGSL